jgi:hypothetical protein
MALTKFAFKVSGSNSGSENIHCSVSINGTEVEDDVEITGTADSNQELLYSLDCADAEDVSCVFTVITGNDDALGYIKIHNAGSAKAWSDGKYYQGIWVGSNSDDIDNPYPVDDGATVQIERPAGSNKIPSATEIEAGTPNPITKYRVKETALYNWWGTEANLASYENDTITVAIENFVRTY